MPPFEAVGENETTESTEYTESLLIVEPSVLSVNSVVSNGLYSQIFLPFVKSTVYSTRGGNHASPSEIIRSKSESRPPHLRQHVFAFQTRTRLRPYAH